MVFEKHTVDTIYTVGPVNFYIFQLSGKRVMFDLGPNSPNVYEYYQKNIDLESIDAIFITHCHVDHYGIINYVKQKSKAKIFFPKYDYIRNKNFEKVIEGTCKILVDEGFSKDTLFKIEGLIKYFESELPHIEDGYIVEDNIEEIRSMGIEVIYAPWHSQSDLIYILNNYAVSGDVFLEEIVSTPLLSVDLNNFEKRFSNFDAFIETIIRIKNIEDKIFLPGHKDEIKNIGDVIFFQINKFIERAKKIGDQLKNKNIFNLVFDNIESIANDPYALYIKASEMFFLRDYEFNKENLHEALSKTFPNLLKKIKN